MTVSASAVCPDVLAFRGSALAAFDELAQACTLSDLLRTAHLLWCGPSCPRDVTCPFLHYRRSRGEPARPQAVRSRYNRDTAHLFALMGGDGYAAGIPQAHEVDGWPLLERVLAEVDIARSGGRLALDYTDWTKKGDLTPARTVSSVCRDALQWMACWCGERYAADPTAVRYIALTTVVDDICVPPLDLLDGSFRIYGRCARDLVEAMERQGWGRDGTHVLLSLVRQYLLQYAEKVGAGVHAELSRSVGVWDSVVYRTHTANTYAAAVVIARVTGSGPLTTDQIMDSAICDAISMDLCKSATRVYKQDDHQPTSGPLERARRIGYHSIYLDLIDDLVDTGTPEPLVHFGRAGFLFVQLQDRYQ